MEFPASRRFVCQPIQPSRKQFRGDGRRIPDPAPRLPVWRRERMRPNVDAPSRCPGKDAGHGGAGDHEQPHQEFHQPRKVHLHRGGVGAFLEPKSRSSQRRIWSSGPFSQRPTRSRMDRPTRRGVRAGIVWFPSFSSDPSGFPPGEFRSSSTSTMARFSSGGEIACPCPWTAVLRWVSRPMRMRPFRRRPAAAPGTARRRRWSLRRSAGGPHRLNSTLRSKSHQHRDGQGRGFSNVVASTVAEAMNGVEWAAAGFSVNGDSISEQQFGDAGG